jgi:hypothetical protein
MNPRVSGLIMAAAALLAALGLAEEAPVTFVDVAAAGGLTAPNVFGPADRKRYTLESTGNGCAFLDYDRDGALDILLVGGSTLESFARGGDPLCALYRGDGKGHFRDVTAAAGLSRRGWGMGVTVADFDNDGFDDLYLTGFGGNVLYRNQGNGTFADVTARAGVADGGWSTGAAFGDYDADGFVDLFVTHYVRLDLEHLPEFGSDVFCRYRGIPVHCGPKGLPAETGRLYHNNRDGTFTDVSAGAGILRERRFYGFTVLWTDYDDDGRPDIFVANDSTPNVLYRNQGDGTFKEVALEVGVAVSGDGREQACMGADFGDYDGDGRLDLFVTNFSDDYSTLYRHESKELFTDVSTRAGIGAATWNSLGWGAGFLDYDNDGWLDLFEANGHIYPEVDAYRFGTRYRQRSQLFRNLGNGTFQDLAGRAGADLDIPRPSRGAAFGDYDDDGDTDILLVNINEAPALLENRGGDRRSWIGFRVEGARANRGGIGSRIRVWAGGRLWTAEVRSSASYLSSNDPRVRIGLGSAAEAERVEIRWPGGEIERFEHLPAGRYYRLRQGAGPERVNRR